MMTDGPDFYRDLPVLESFLEASKAENYHPLPDNWLVAVADIEASTKALNENRYKLVNILGASPIVGLLNHSGRQNVAFTFNGDGCAVCIPPGMFDMARNIFAACRKIGHHEYELNMRAAIYPIEVLRRQGTDVRVARYRVSEVYNQAIFMGRGLELAERKLKDDPGSEYHLSQTDAVEPVDFSGLECRWKEVRPKNKQVITLLVKSTGETFEQEQIYQGVLEKMNEIFGFDELTNPIERSELGMSISLKDLAGEIKLRTFGESPLKRFLYIIKLELQIILGKIFMWTGFKTSATDWGRYKKDLALNTDHRKFDDMIRVVISGTEEQYRAMIDYLETEHRKNRLAFGTHLADSAMITCMVFEYHRNHIHFVDGSKGGYVKAFHDLKSRL